LLLLSQNYTNATYVLLPLNRRYNHTRAAPARQPHSGFTLCHNFDSEATNGLPLTSSEPSAAYNTVQWLMHSEKSQIRGRFTKWGRRKQHVTASTSNIHSPPALSSVLIDNNQPNHMWWLHNESTRLDRSITGHQS